MKTRRMLISILLAFMVILSVGCQPAATATNVPTMLAATDSNNAEPTSPPVAEPTATEAVEPTAAESTEKITLQVWSMGQEAPSDPNNPSYMEEIIAGFKKIHPNVTLEWSLYSFDDMNRSLRLALDGGTGPDVANASAGLTGTDAYANAGHLVDLTDIAKERGWDKHYTQDLLNFANINVKDKKIYGIPTLNSTVGVFYNPEIFDKYGLKVPTTFDEFQQILATLKEKGVTPFAVGGLEGWPLGHYWEQLIHLNTPFEDLTRLYVLDPTATFDSPTMIQAAAILQDWAKKGYFQENYLGTNFADSNKVFINGDAAMTVTGTWEMGEFTDLPKFEVHFFPMPPMDPNMPRHTGGQSPDNNWIVSKYSQHQEMAIEFINYVLGEESAKFIWEEGLIPNYEFDQTPPPSTILQGEVYKAIQETSVGYYMGFTPEVLQAEGTLLQQLCSGQITPEQAMADLQKANLAGLQNVQ